MLNLLPEDTNLVYITFGSCEELCMDDVFGTLVSFGDRELVDWSSKADGEELVR